MEQKVSQVFTLDAINPILSVVEASVIRLLQIEERKQLLEEKLQLLGLFEIDPKAAIESRSYSDLVALDLLSDLTVFNAQIKEERGFLAAKGAVLDLVADGKLSWPGVLNNNEIFWSWQVGDGWQIKYWRDIKVIFEKRQSI